jgi:short-subunit dehydrogenase
VKTVVITGASSGFGKGLALQFAGAGCALVLAARRGDALEEVALQCQTLGASVASVIADVSRREDMAAIAREALTRFERIDVWINNAGVGALGRFGDIPLDDHVQVIATNLLGTVYGSYEAWQQFRKQKSGTLINIASALGKIPAPYYSSYTASKHGVVGLCDSLRQELAESDMPDVHVCTVLPMAMDTFFFDHAANYTGREAVPVPPLYDPQQVIDTVARLVNEPQDEVIVGAAGKVMNVLHHVLPGPVEKLMQKEVQIVQMEAPAPAPATSGSVHQPIPEGSEVRAGRLKRRRKSNPS